MQHDKYSPVGKRGIGLGLGQGFGAQFKEYIETANDHIMVAVQIEHIDAVHAVDAIAAQALMHYSLVPMTYQIACSYAVMLITHG